MDGLVMNWRSAMMAMAVAVVLVCGIILLLRRTERASSFYLGIVLILAGCSMGPQIIGFANGYDIWPWLTFFPLFDTELWVGPLLYLHADRLMRGGPLGWRKWLLLPGILQTLYYCGAFILPGLFDHEAKWEFTRAVHSPYIMPIESALAVAMLLWAIFMIWRMRRSYLEYLDQTQSAARDYDPVWLHNLIVGLVIAVILFGVLEIMFLIAEQNYYQAFPVQLLLIGLMVWLGLDAAWRLTAPFPKMAQAINPPTLDVQDTQIGLAEMIDKKLRDQEWFLESRLSIRDVASRLGSNESYVSRAVNSGLGQSFNRYVNGLRVEYAKRLMRQTEQPILSIALDSGFNSKATFNCVFREIAGLTPPNSESLRTRKSPIFRK